MVKTIQIFNANDRYFGPLSNNYLQDLLIDGVIWKSVTHYIYSNIIRTQTLHIKNLKIDDFIQQYYYLYSEEYRRILRSALKTSLLHRIKTNIDLKELLLNTGLSRLIYLSNDPDLGMKQNEEGILFGNNIYGQVLEQIRHEILEEDKMSKKLQKEKERNDNIYKAYLAKQAVEYALFEGKDLNEYLNLDLDQIIDKYGRQKIIRKSISYDNFINADLYKRENFSALLHFVIHPESLILTVKKENMRTFKDRQIYKRRKVIFNTYVDYMLKIHFPNLNSDEYELAKNQQFDKLSSQDLQNLEIKVQELFENDQFDTDLQKEIEIKTSDIYIPTKNNIELAEAYEITYDIEHPEIDVQFNSSLQNENIYISTDIQTEYFKLSPIYEKIFILDGKKYPTIVHYYLVQLLTIYKKINLTESYNLLIKIYLDANLRFPSIDEIFQTYVNVKSQLYEDFLKENCYKALEIKFQDRNLQDILIVTGNAKLVWADYSDDILGIGPNKKGKNYVGKKLEMIRQEVNKQRETENIEMVTEQNIDKLLRDNSILRSWLQMRVTDICRTVYIMKMYLWKKDQINQEIDFGFVEDIFRNIYQPCSQLFGMVDQVNIPMPDYFLTQYIKRNKGFNDVDDEVAIYIWKHIVVMLYYLIRYMQLSSVKNVGIVLTSVSQLSSQKQNCVRILENEKTNCITSAILNILKGIQNFNKKYSNSSEIKDRDVDIAIKILSGSIDTKDPTSTTKKDLTSLYEEKAQELLSVKEIEEIEVDDPTEFYQKAFGEEVLSAQQVNKDIEKLKRKQREEFKKKRQMVDEDEEEEIEEDEEEIEEIEEDDDDEGKEKDYGEEEEEDLSSGEAEEEEEEEDEYKDLYDMLDEL